MPVFTVHAPPPSDDNSRPAPERFVFLRDGFYVWALVFGPLWLAYHRLWLALIGYLVVCTAVTLSLSALNVGAGGRFATLLLIAILLGLEAGSLLCWTLSRRRFRQLDLVVADDQDAAERRFFDRWTSVQPHPVGFSLPIDRGAPPPTRNIPLPAASLQGDIVGSFPRPGANR
jgi:hypothetical protein